METLIPVIVGGIIGVLGGIAGPPLSHWLNEGAAKKKKRAEKLEELMGILYAHDHWLDIMRNIRVFGEEDTREPAPLPKALAIAAIYFPQFSADLSELDSLSRKLELWMMQGATKRVAGNLDTLAEGAVEAQKPYYQKLLRVLDALQNFAKNMGK